MTHPIVDEIHELIDKLNEQDLRSLSHLLIVFELDPASVLNKLKADEQGAISRILLLTTMAKILSMPVKSPVKDI